MGWKKSALLNVLLLVASVWLSLVLIEASLELFACLNKTAVDVNRPDQVRIAAAHRLGLPFDTRDMLQVVRELRAKQGIDAHPWIAPQNFVYSNGIAFRGHRLLPLGGISRCPTVYCNECGQYTIYEADEHGFNNPVGLWSRPGVDLLLVGDSFAHGACVPPGADLGSQLRRFGQTVVNIGHGGNGPLLDLAGIVEYDRPLKPKIVLWLYCENDLSDLTHEQKSPLLQHYLQAGFTQSLINRQEEIDQALLAWSEPQLTSQPAPNHRSPHWYDGAKKIFRLSEVRNRLQLLLAPNPLPVLQEVLARADRYVHASGGQLYFVFLPDYERYAGKVDDDAYGRRKQVLNLVRKLKVPLIDFHPVLKNHPDPLSLFPFRLPGHFTPEGYRLLAETIMAALPPGGKYHGTENHPH